MFTNSFGLTPWPRVEVIELLRVRLPLVRVHAYAGGEEREREVALVRGATADGVEGWGECSSLSTVGYVRETLHRSWQALRDELAPQWLAGRSPSADADAPMAYAALEEAAVDLSLRDRGLALVDELSSGAGSRSSVEWCAVIGLRDDARTVLQEIGDALAIGAAQIKLKITPQRDIALLTSVREVHPDMALAVDANGSYPSASAVPPALADFRLAYLEQPLPPDDLVGSSRVEAEIGVPVALDESVDSLARLTEARELGAGSILNVKVARLGGLEVVQSTLAELQRTGTRAFVGGMLETALGRAIGLAVAAQAPCVLPCDLGPTSRYFTRDIGPSFEPDEDGRLSPPTGLGVGVVPDRDALDEFCVDRVLLES